jgi:hypothetical protein
MRHHRCGKPRNIRTEITVADLATETNTVEPVREYHGAHACFVGELVDDNVTIFRPGRFVVPESKNRCQEGDGHP